MVVAESTDRYTRNLAPVCRGLLCENVVGRLGAWIQPLSQSFPLGAYGKRDERSMFGAESFFLKTATTSNTNEE
ncbi:hypothetical protein DBR26_29835, partial [Pseudomonas sp. HMWF007]